MWTFSFCSNARSFDCPTVAKSGEKIKVPIFIRRKGAEVFHPALTAGGSLMAYKCLSLCGLFSFFKGFSENLFHAGFQFIQIEGWSLHGKTENFLLFRVGEIALIVLEHSLPCVLHHFKESIYDCKIISRRLQSNCGKTHAIFRRCAFPSSATADPAGRAMAAAGAAAFCGLCAAGCFPPAGKRRCLSQRTVAGRKSRAARPRNGSARSVRYHDRHPGCGQPERGNAGQWLFEFIEVA